MITNPKIGHRVIISHHSGLFNGSIANIFYISTDRETIGIKITKSFNTNIIVGTEYYFRPRYLEFYNLTIEEQDLLNRERHADKYL